MKPAIVALCCICGLAAAGGPLAANGSPLRLVQKITLDGVEGRIDHMTLDRAGQRMFVVALGSNTVEVLDLRTGRRARSLSGFSEPQGVGFVSSPPRLFVSNGGDGSVTVLEADSFRVLRHVSLGEDADNVRVDEAADRVYVGYGDGALATLNATTGELLGRAALTGHPEGFQLERDGQRVFVNVPDASEVTIVDRERGEPVAHWRLNARANFPMALDTLGRRVFVGCRNPAVLVALDLETGAKLDQRPIAGDVDDLYFDARKQWVLASCGAGLVDIVEAIPGRNLRLVIGQPTAAGARTSMFDEDTRRLYIAVPHRGAQSAEVRVFEVAQ